MDTLSPAALVNGGLLRLHVGRKVRAVIQVMRSDVGSVMGKSTDNCQLIVKGSPPVPLTSYVEVIGVAENDNSIRAEIWTNFGDSFALFYRVASGGAVLEYSNSQVKQYLYAVFRLSEAVKMHPAMILQMES